VVTTVLTDADLRADWEAEVSEMRNRVNSLRAGLAAELQRQTNSDRFGMLMRQKGMFSKLGLSGAEVEALRNDHAVYAVGDSRINIAGLKLEEIPHLAQAIAAVI
jgi:aromatic-amino-acid transaminase